MLTAKQEEILIGALLGDAAVEYNGLSGEKDVVPPNRKDLLSSKLTLAVWYLDDGSKRTDSNAYRFHTECLFLKSVKELMGALRSNFDIESKKHNHRNAATKLVAEKGYLIHIGSTDGHAKKLNGLIKNFVASEIPSMLYKFF